MEFGGADMGTVPDDDALDLENFTLAAWVNIPKISGAWQIVASKENRNPTGRTMVSSATSIPGSSITPSQQTLDGNRLMRKPLSPMAIGITSQVLTMVLTSSSTLMDKQDAQTSPGTKPDTSDNLFFIGGCDIGNYWMSGTIDEVVLYDKALSEKELNELMEDGISVAFRRATRREIGNDMEPD